jgi:hypothetical protein
MTQLGIIAPKLSPSSAKSLAAWLVGGLEKGDPSLVPEYAAIIGSLPLDPGSELSERAMKYIVPELVRMGVRTNKLVSPLKFVKTLRPEESKAILNALYSSLSIEVEPLPSTPGVPSAGANSDWQAILEATAGKLSPAEEVQRTFDAIALLIENGSNANQRMHCAQALTLLAKTPGNIPANFLPERGQPMLEKLVKALAEAESGARTADAPEVRWKHIQDAYALAQGIASLTHMPGLKPSAALSESGRKLFGELLQQVLESKTPTDLQILPVLERLSRVESFVPPAVLPAQLQAALAHSLTLVKEHRPLKANDPAAVAANTQLLYLLQLMELQPAALPPDQVVEVLTLVLDLLTLNDSDDELDRLSLARALAPHLKRLPSSQVPPVLDLLLAFMQTLDKNDLNFDQEQALTTLLEAIPSITASDAQLRTLQQVIRGDWQKRVRWLPRTAKFLPATNVFALLKQPNFVYSQPALIDSIQHTTNQDFGQSFWRVVDWARSQGYDVAGAPPPLEPVK